MKSFLFLIFLIVASTTATVAQQRTRDVLFPHFNEDMAKLKQKEAATTPGLGSKTREAIFTNYHAQATSTPKVNTLAARSRAASKPLPSDISSEASMKQKTEQQSSSSQPTTPPSQGEEPKESKTTTVKKKH